LGNGHGSEQLGGKAGLEQRKSPRKKVLLTSKIVYGEGTHVLDCTIRDISATGARVTLRSRCSIPASVYLLDMANRIAYASAVVSERADGYGLKFLNTYRLAQVNKPELVYLKRIWIQYAG
jgi:PilZ domain